VDKTDISRDLSPLETLSVALWVDRTERASGTVRIGLSGRDGPREISREIARDLSRLTK